MCPGHKLIFEICFCFFSHGMIYCFRVTHVHDFGVLSPPHDDKMLDLHEQLYVKLLCTANL